MTAHNYIPDSETKMINDKSTDGFITTCVILIYVAVFFGFYILFLNQSLSQAFNWTGPLGGFPSETYHHMMFAQPLLHGSQSLELAPSFEPLFHILTAAIAFLIEFISSNNEKMNLANAAAIVLAAAKLWQFIIIKKIIKENTVLSEGRILFLTIVVNLCTSIYLPFISLNIYMPMLTPNILIDPTSILLTPFTILFFYSYVKNYIKRDSLSYKKSILLSLLLVLATLAKPAFTNIFLVVISCYYILNLKRFFSLNFFHDIIIYLPSLIILVGQIFLISTSLYTGIEFAPYKIISIFSNHPFIALFQAIGFPLLVSVVYFFKTNIKKCEYLCLAWLFSIFAYLLFALFSFEGPTYDAGNLGWSWQIGLTLLYLFSLVAYGQLILANSTVVISRFLVKICAIGFGLIFLSGINQFIKIFLGGNYF